MLALGGLNALLKIYFVFSYDIFLSIKKYSIEKLPPTCPPKQAQWYFLSEGELYENDMFI